MKTTACGRCGRQIVWARTPQGRSMPLDPTPTPAGNAFAQYENGVLIVRVKTKDDPRPVGTPMMPHFATCRPDDKPAPTPKAAPKPPPPEEPTLF